MVVVLAALAGLPWLACLALGPRGRRWRAWARRVLRRGDPSETPLNRPIEQIAADVRRRGERFHASAAHASYVRVSALRSAYDLVLGECCDSLGHAHLLSVLRPGPELDRERRRVELLLQSYGLPVDHSA